MDEKGEHFPLNAQKSTVPDVGTASPIQTVTGSLWGIEKHKRRKLLFYAIGIHYIFGAFIFGLVFPNGPLGVTLIERLEDFVSGLLLPLFFAIRDTEISKIDGVGTWALLVQVTVLACAGKIVGTVLVTLYYRIPIHEGVILGILMNSKGLIEMIVINIGIDQKHLVLPRNLQYVFMSSVLSSELTGRASAMLIVHNTRKTGKPALNRTQVQSDHIINAFENFEKHVGCVSVQPLTVISPYSTMHEDVCSIAEDKRVAFLIIPFHKQQIVDGGMGLSGSTRLAANQVTRLVAVLFFGGPDDREALS
ncbi:Cation/H(+) antiporter 15 [Capsicum chinense]|nr:Cation/H(+) antiporter 15 [Capsicum chinense]